MPLSRPHTIDLHFPRSFIGYGLGEWEKKIFDSLKDLAKKFIKSSTRLVNHSVLVQALDEINQTKNYSDEKVMRILGDFVSLLRVYILSNQPNVVVRATVFSDALVKNCGSRIHVLIGRKSFMKTLSIQARRFRQKSGASNHEACYILLDTIQAWGEAFYTRQVLYPHIFGTYNKLKYKYGITFPRPDYDPTRVPIFLGPLTTRENILVRNYGDDNTQKIAHYVTSPISNDSEALKTLCCATNDVREGACATGNPTVDNDRKISIQNSQSSSSSKYIDADTSIARDSKSEDSPSLLEFPDEPSNESQSSQQQKTNRSCSDPQPPLPPPPDDSKRNCDSVTSVIRPDGAMGNRIVDINPQASTSSESVWRSAAPRKYASTTSETAMRLSPVNSQTLGLDEEVKKAFEDARRPQRRLYRPGQVQDRSRNVSAGNIMESAGLYGDEQLVQDAASRRARPGFTTGSRVLYGRSMSGPPVGQEANKDPRRALIPKLDGNKLTLDEHRHLLLKQRSRSSFPSQPLLPPQENKGTEPPPVPGGAGTVVENEDEIAASSSATKSHKSSAAATTVKTKASVFTNPSSDPSLKVQYFGMQRVLTKPASVTSAKI